MDYFEYLVWLKTIMAILYMIFVYATVTLLRRYYDFKIQSKEIENKFILENKKMDITNNVVEVRKK